MKEEEFPPVYSTSDIVDAVFQDRYGPDHPLADCKFITLEDHQKVIANMASIDDVRYNFENFYDQRELAKELEEECERLRKIIADKETHDMCENMAKENSGIDARQAFNMAIHQWTLRIMSKIADATSRGDICYYADVPRSEVPMYKEIAKRLTDKGYTTEWKESDDLAHLEVSWMLADEKEPDDDRIQPIKRIKDLPEDRWGHEDDKSAWTLNQWHDKVVDLNGMISFLQTEQTKMQNKMNQITIENTWLEADSYKIPFNKQVVACLEDEQLVIGVLTTLGEFRVQYVIDPRNDTKINAAVIKQWKYATWPKP